LDFTLTYPTFASEIRGVKGKGNGIVPFFFVRNLGMNTENYYTAIEQFLTQYLETQPDIFIVEIKIAPGNKIQVFADNDKGLTIENCTKMNRALYKHIEETGLFPPDDFSIEVSSPGIDEPLKLHRQYVKNIGRTVEVVMQDGTVREGVLKSADEEGIVIEEKEGKGKKAVVKTSNLLFNQIKHVTVLVTF
jgi:ribosome maturation factor RimP